MTAEFESTVEVLLVLLTVTCIVQVIFVGLLFWYVKRVADRLGGAGRAGVAPPAPVAEAVSAPKGLVTEKAEPAILPRAPAVEILGGSPDIQGSIHRLCEKHALSDFIISTLDGLVVVSLYPGSSEEAAQFSDLYRRKKKPDSPAVTFLEIGHRGEAMLGIIRADRILTPEQTKEIEEDARKILNWWL